MISQQYCMVMARYNAWQNSQLTGFLEAMDAEDLTVDRGAFFGSILGTLNHLLWGDMLWISRFDGGEASKLGGQDSTRLCPDLATWAATRGRVDARISDWAAAVSDEQLQGSLRFFSGIAGREMVKPMALCVVQVFNHQTHHRGQVHAMLTAAGSKAPVSDLPFMPDAPSGVQRQSDEESEDV